VLHRRRRAGQWARAGGGPDVRHRGRLPWDDAPIPRRWHACRPQTVKLHREHGVLTGSDHRAAGAVNNRPGGWRCRSTRRHRDPAGLCRRTRMPQPVRAQVVAGITPHPGARHHLRFHPAGSA